MEYVSLGLALALTTYYGFKFSAQIYVKSVLEDPTGGIIPLDIKK